MLKKQKKLIQEAQMLEAKADFAGAKESYLKAMNLASTNSQILFSILKSLGNIAVKEANFTEAEDYYNKAYTLDPGSDVLLVNFGTLEIQKGDLERAKIRFRQAIDRNPVNDKAWVGLALIHREHGDKELARANIERALDLDEYNETALQLAIDWALHDGKVDSVISWIEESLDSHIAEGEEDNLDRRFLLARLMFCCDRFKHAQKEVETILRADSNFEDARKLAGLIQKEVR